MKFQDKYLHTNCLAALANMSSQFRSLHPYVCQRLVSLFETLAKRHARLCESLKHTEDLLDEADSDMPDAVSMPVVEIFKSWIYGLIVFSVILNLSTTARGSPLQVCYLYLLQSYTYFLTHFFYIFFTCRSHLLRGFILCFVKLKR